MQFNELSSFTIFFLYFLISENRFFDIKSQFFNIKKSIFDINKSIPFLLIYNSSVISKYRFIDIKKSIFWYQEIGLIFHIKIWFLVSKYRLLYEGIQNNKTAPKGGLTATSYSLFRIVWYKKKSIFQGGFLYQKYFLISKKNFDVLT